MDNNNSTAQPQPPRQTWQALADEHQALRILELEDENQTLRELVSESLTLLHAANERDARHREQHERLVLELRGLRAMLLQLDRAA